MNKCRENNTIGWYKTVITCLKELYLQLKSEEADYSSVAWTELKELAKKFALSLGFDAKKVRQPLVGIHRYRLASSPGLRERGRPEVYRQGMGGLKSALTACNPLFGVLGVPLYVYKMWLFLLQRRNCVLHVPGNQEVRSSRPLQASSSP